MIRRRAPLSRRDIRDCNDKWYYDACALEEGRNTFGEMYSRKKHNSITSIASFLSLGEAYGNCHIDDVQSGHRSKSLTWESKVKAFVDLIDKLRHEKLLHIETNEGVKTQLNFVLEAFPELDIPDALHLATALKNKCTVLRTSDPDLLSLRKDDLIVLAQTCGYSKISITSF